MVGIFVSVVLIFLFLFVFSCIFAESHFGKQADVLRRANREEMDDYDRVIREAHEKLRKIQEEIYRKQKSTRQTYQRTYRQTTYRSHWSAPKPPVTVRDVSLDLAILGLSVTANTEEIKSAYRTLCMKYHPDINPSGAKKFIEINQAYSRLMGK